MGLKMENVNMLGCSLKNPTFREDGGGGGSWETDIEGGLPKKRDLGSLQI